MVSTPSSTRYRRPSSRLRPQPRPLDTSFTAMTQFSSFQAHVERNLHSGTDIGGRESKYICYDSLVTYWTPSKANDILRNSLGENAAFITQRIFRERYLMIFSVIVYISSARQSYVEEITRFLNSETDDHRLPLAESPSYFPRDAWKLFEQHQWKFCPIRLVFPEYPRTRDKLDSRCVFPGLEVSRESIGRAAVEGAGSRDASFKYMALGRDPGGKKNEHRAVRLSDLPFLRRLTLLGGHGCDKVLP